MLNGNDNYLNFSGLSKFFSKLKTIFVTKDELGDIKGEQGVSVTTIEQTATSTEDGGTNTITVTLSDGTTSTFNVKNGSTGLKGDKGDTPTLDFEVKSNGHLYVTY